MNYQEMLDKETNISRKYYQLQQEEIKALRKQYLDEHDHYNVGDVFMHNNKRYCVMEISSVIMDYYYPFPYYVYKVQPIFKNGRKYGKLTNIYEYKLENFEFKDFVR